jgi:transposase
MQTLVERGCGLDVHQATVVACLLMVRRGVDMSVFGSVSQLASWAGVCPGNNESAGKRKSSRIPSGNVYLNSGLVEAANAAARAESASCNLRN